MRSILTGMLQQVVVETGSVRASISGGESRLHTAGMVLLQLQMETEHNLVNMR